MPQEAYKKSVTIRMVREAVRLGWLPCVALLLSGCNEKKTACESAVQSALKDPGEYAAIRIDEQYGQGNAFNEYYVYFQYGTEGSFRGLAYCTYDNNTDSASVKILG